MEKKVTKSAPLELVDMGETIADISIKKEVADIQSKIYGLKNQLDELETKKEELENEIAEAECYTEHVKKRFEEKCTEINHGCNGDCKTCLEELYADLHEEEEENSNNFYPY
jgi:chromosome segregation ATPase